MGRGYYQIGKQKICGGDKWSRILYVKKKRGEKCLSGGHVTSVTYHVGHLASSTLI